MTRAAKALERMNGAPDASLASLAVVPAKKKIVDSDSSDSDNDEPLALTMGADGQQKYFKDIGDQALFEADTLESQMNEMFKELNEMQNMIKGNADLKTYENLKDTTKEVMDTHMSAYSKLKDNIIDITKDADSAIDDLNFYQEDDDDNFEAKPKLPNDRG